MRYEENPFVEVEKLADGVWSLLSPGGCPTLCYLVEGAERALLIDTGFGVGDLKALCERLTDKPLLVVDTHSHGDHVLGNPQFDRVYIHALDLEAGRAANEPEQRRRFMDAPGTLDTEDSRRDTSLTWAAATSWRCSTRPATRPAASACWRRSAACSSPATPSCARPR